MQWASQGNFFLKKKLNPKRFACAVKNDCLPKNFNKFSKTLTKPLQETIHTIFKNLFEK